MSWSSFVLNCLLPLSLSLLCYLSYLSFSITDFVLDKKPCLARSRPHKPADIRKHLPELKPVEKLRILTWVCAS